MPQITDIKPQVKKPGYYNIFVDGKFALALSELDLSSNSLKVGQQLNGSELSDLHKTYTSSKCYHYALRYLATRPRSVSEMRDYLLRKQFSESDIDSAITKLEQSNYLNDQNFAELWVENRMRLNPKSSSVLSAELVKKGIDRDIISEVLSSLSYEDQLASLISIIESKAHQTRYKDKQKIIEYLARKGYSYGLIKEALESTNFYPE
jgi:regulatory protein